MSFTASGGRGGLHPPQLPALDSDALAPCRPVGSSQCVCPTSWAPACRVLGWLIPWRPLEMEDVRSAACCCPGRVPHELSCGQGALGSGPWKGEWVWSWGWAGNLGGDARRALPLVMQGPSRLGSNRRGPVPTVTLRTSSVGGYCMVSAIYALCGVSSDRVRSLLYTGVPRQSQQGSASSQSSQASQ